MKKFYYYSLYFCFISISLILASCSNSYPTAPYSPGAISGYTRDSGTHTLLPGVVVYIYPYNISDTSDANGFFRVADLQMGSTSTNVILIVSKPGYLTDTADRIVIPSGGELTNVILTLFPGNNIFKANDIILEQNALSCLDLMNLLPVNETGMQVDARFRDSANQSFYINTGFSNITGTGFRTKFSNSLDTLASFYGASNPINPINDFPFDSTSSFSISNNQQSVYAFYLAGRNTSGTAPIYGLIYIDALWRDTTLNKFILRVDVKSNRNGLNIFG